MRSISRFWESSSSIMSILLIGYCLIRQSLPGHESACRQFLSKQCFSLCFCSFLSVSVCAYQYQPALISISQRLSVSASACLYQPVLVSSSAAERGCLQSLPWPCPPVLQKLLLFPSSRRRLMASTARRLVPVMCVKEHFSSS